MKLKELRDYLFVDTGDSVKWRRDVAATIIGSLVIIIVVAAVSFLAQVSSGGEARSLLNSLMPTTRFLASGIMTASTTILALMVTLLSLSLQKKDKLDDIILKRIRQLATVTTATLIVVVVFLSMHNLPIKDSSEISQGILVTAYYIFVGLAALLSGLLVGVVLLLFFTLKQMIHSVAPNLDK